MSDETKKKDGEEKEMKIPLKEIGVGLLTIATNKKIQKIVLGEYSDGKVRSLPDALNEEILSPQQKQKYKNKKKNKKKKFKYE